MLSAKVVKEMNIKNNTSILIKTESRFPVSREKIREIVIKVLTNQGINSDCEVSISFVGDRKICELSKKYLGRDYPTDVLAFPLETGGGLSKRSTMDAPFGFVSPPDDILHLGDIVISYPTALVQAAGNNILVDEEVNNLVEHGLLHLLGRHHEE